MSTLASEMREAALDMERTAQISRCYSTIQHIIASATDHISAAAGNAEKNDRIVALEAENATLKQERDEAHANYLRRHQDAADAEIKLIEVEAERDHASSHSARPQTETKASPHPIRSRADMMDRSRFDGKPYYCDLCGCGWAEYIACEEDDCELESERTAEDRKQEQEEKDVCDANPVEPT